jgi:hypothetical protein
LVLPTISDLSNQILSTSLTGDALISVCFNPAFPVDEAAADAPSMQLHKSVKSVDPPVPLLSLD